jgi:hypothetical protein
MDVLILFPCVFIGITYVVETYKTIYYIRTDKNKHTAKKVLYEVYQYSNNIATMVL